MSIASELREAEAEILARRPEHAIEPTLDRMAALVSILGDPQRSYPVVHITGTNGKTSTARMIESLLRARGLRTGLFTSPHLSSIRERIMVDGQPVSAETFVAAYDELAPYLAMVDGQQATQLSFFEVLTGLAFAIFADVPVDVAVIEVGLGGTWDATNIADGAVAVVTPISLDHTAYLGGTVEEIAADKAGIIKPGAVAVLAQQPLPAAEALLRRVVTVGASVVREGLEFGVLNRDLAVGGQRLDLRGLRGDYTDIVLPLFGAYQAGNAAVALAAVEAFAGGAPLPGQSLDAQAPDDDGSPDEAWTGSGEAEAGPGEAEAGPGEAEAGPGEAEAGLGGADDEDAPGSRPGRSGSSLDGTEPSGGRWAGSGPRGVRAGHVPGPARGGPPQPGRHPGRGAQPGGHGSRDGGRHRGVHVRRADRGARGQRGQGRGRDPRPDGAGDLRAGGHPEFLRPLDGPGQARRAGRLGVRPGAGARRPAAGRRPGDRGGPGRRGVR